jgi:hypothetical protein
VIAGPAGAACGGAVLLIDSAVDDPDVLVEAAPAHGGAIAAATSGRDRPGPAIHMQDALVLEVGQMVDRQAHPLGVVLDL